MSTQSTIDEMISEHVSSVLKVAINTFRSTPETFEYNLEKLARLFSKTTATHVNLNPMFMKESTWKMENKAPMTYIGILHNDILNMGIFILKPNMKLPLHNHPHMYGLLKVVAGTVNIKSFSIKTENIITMDTEKKILITAEKNEDIILDSKSDCCVLDPVMGNIHEIETIGGPAAFIDILSPPYDTALGNTDYRKCSYFRVRAEKGPKIFELEEIVTPSWFWSDTFPYEGPQPRVDI